MAGVSPAGWHSYASMTFYDVTVRFLRQCAQFESFSNGESDMAPSETGYLFLLSIGFLSLAATVAVAITAYRHRRQQGR
jgi:hypothetical protein